MSRRTRFVVTGLNGQLAQALAERGRDEGDLDVVPLGRPHLNLEEQSCIETIVRAASPDVIVSAAAYTAVEIAETDQATAYAVNSTAPRILARVAEAMRVPIIHLSTDYVFDGTKSTPYIETDAVGPVSVYGQSKLEGERSVAAATGNHAILRTAWLYSPFGRNFVRTVIRIAKTSNELRVVEDQLGSPTSALDLAIAIIGVGRNLLASDNHHLRGTFHLAGSGEASWADVAEEVLRVSQAIGGPFAGVQRILTSEYETAARRPANSRLNCSRIRRHHGIGLPHWTSSIEETVRRIIRAQMESETSE